MQKTFIIITLGFFAVQFGKGQPAKLGTPYGTREPPTCPSTKEPAKGVITPELAKRYLRCNGEGIGPGNNMYLLENVSIEVGKGTPFLQLDPRQRPGSADPDGLVFPTRGTYTVYQCAVPNKINNKFGKNCNTYESKQATGQCYRSGFGDWTCTMVDNATNNPQNRTDVAPPK